MKKNVKIALIVFIVVIVATFTSVFASMYLTSDFTLEEVQEDRANLEDLIITETKDGKKYWEIYAKIGYYNASEDDIILEDLTGNFYENNEVSMSFSADKGNYKSKSKTVTLIDNAKVLYDDGSYISASSIHWSGVEDEITAVGYVEMYKNDLVTNSDKSVFDTNFTNFQLFGNADTKVYNSRMKKKQKGK